MTKSNETDQELSLGAIDYDVNIVEDLRGSDGRVLWGDIEYNTSTIRLDAEMGPTPRLITLIHEAFHALLAAAGYSDHHEKQLIVLAHGTVAMFRDNQWLRDRLDGTE